jgi:hypothetical protein
VNRGPSEPRGATIDAARWFERIVAAGVLPVSALERVAPDVPDTFAVLGMGATESGGALLVGFSPTSGGDAALATLAHAQRLLAEQSFTGEAVALAPDWSIGSRRRLELLRAPALRFRAMAVSALAEDGGAVESEPPEAPVVVSPRQLAAQLPRAEERDLFLRGLEAFAGLAAKHGGSVRGARGGAELVLLARRVAVLQPRERNVVLEMLEPERSSTTLVSDGLATAIDRLEGLLRKRLNDGRVRDGEEGLRAQLVPQLVNLARLRDAALWPLGGSDPEVIDLAALGEDGRPVVAALRERLTLPALAAILDAALALRPALPALFAAAAPPVRVGTPRLLLAAREFDGLVLRALPVLGIEASAFDVRGARGGLELAAREALVASAPVLEARVERPAPEPRPERREPPPRFQRPEPEPRPFVTPDAAEPPATEAAAAPMAMRFEAVSLFDLADEEASAAPRRAEGEEPGGRPRRRRGRRRRGRGGMGGGGGDREGRAERPPAAAAATSEPDLATEAEPSEPWGAAAADTDAERGEEAGLLDVDEAEDLAATLHPLGEEVPEVEEETAPSYDDEEEFAGEPVSDEERERRERELRRRARIAKAAPEVEPEVAPQLPRRRAAFVAHADRESVTAAIVLARDLRMVEGFWVYPQSELMTFFRGVATDLRSETPIYLIGFTASPARDLIQAAALYSGRIAWFDHHDWPPEDVENLRLAIGKENVHVQPGAGSSLPLVLGTRTRRSRFSDKLVELATARFSLHDYERWGRLWWQRLGDIASAQGDKRAAIEPLLIGRPSDLAHDAGRAPTPPPPPEVDFVAGRDFRIVHFGGYSLVVIGVPRALDLHLTARIARERYGAQLSVAFTEGDELVVITGDEVQTRRGFDLGRLVNHVASQHTWITALSDADHLARMRVHGLAAHPERLDEVIAEIAMGRAIFEG